MHHILHADGAQTKVLKYTHTHTHIEAAVSTHANQQWGLLYLTCVLTVTLQFSVFS